MDILQQVWGWSLIYSAVMLIGITIFPKPKNRKEAFIQLLLSGYIGWAWFLFVETPKHFIRK
jgi:hypothetical protein